VPPLLGPVLVFEVEVWVPPPPGVTPPELDVAGLVVAVFPEGVPEDGATDAGGVVAVVLGLVEECEVACGRLAAAAVGTVSGETPLVFATVEPPPPQPAVATASSTPLRPAAIRRENLDDTELMSRAAPSAARSAGSRSGPSA
jgi:hypothetical protein